MKAGMCIAGLLVMATGAVLVWAEEGELFPELKGTATRPGPMTKETPRRIEPVGPKNPATPVRPTPGGVLLEKPARNPVPPPESKLVRSANPVMLVKPGDRDLAISVLRRIPKDLLPVKTDDQAELTRKAGAIHTWLASDGDFGQGVKVTLTAKFSGASVFDIPRFKGPPPKPGEGPATMQAGDRRLTWRFKQELDFDGLPLRVWITDTRPVKGDDDRELRLSRDLEKSRDAKVTLSGKVTGISLNLSRTQSVSDKGNIAATGEVPTISLTLHMEPGGLTVSNQGAN